jgi:hypothetical protein
VTLFARRASGRTSSGSPVAEGDSARPQARRHAVGDGHPSHHLQPRLLSSEAGFRIINQISWVKPHPPPNALHTAFTHGNAGWSSLVARRPMTRSSQVDNLLLPGWQHGSAIRFPVRARACSGRRPAPRLPPGLGPARTRGPRAAPRPPLRRPGPRPRSCYPVTQRRPGPIPLPLSVCWQSCPSGRPHSPLPASLASLWAFSKRSTYLTLGGKVATGA